MNYGEIKNCDIANGEGVRVSLFVSGCTHHCKGCFNPMTWDFNYGKPFTNETEEKIIKLLAPEYIDGLTLLGGEPMEIENQRVLVSFLEKVKSIYPNKNIWCYTGYTLEKDLQNGGKAECEITEKMLSMIDILVDGEFIMEEKNIALVFRGSENQRIINLKETLKNGIITIKEYE